MLTDFGIAKGLSSDGGDDLTSSNVMMGTAKYLSPEQVRGRKLDGRADLYALGLVLYECLAGRVPFLGESDADTALARLNRDPTDLSRLRPTLPTGLAPLIHRLLSRRPTDRPATGAEVRGELNRIATQSRHHAAMTPPAGTDTLPERPPGERSTGRMAPPQRTPPGGQTRTGRPMGQPVRADRTPPSMRAPRSRPNRAFDHNQRPSMILVGLLLLAALIVGIILWVTSSDDGNASSTPPTTAGAGAPSAGIADVVAYDPEGSDRVENNGLAVQAHDGNPATAWTTVCYRDKFLGGKAGVGLVADLGGLQRGTLTATIASAPYQVQVLASGSDVVPPGFSSWSAVTKADATKPGTVRATLDTPARYVLVMFNELGPDPGCGQNPYRGSITELAFTPS
jgi:hypothetical protein